LRIPISLMSLPHSWQPIIDKIKVKIFNWGDQWLNLVGRLVLLKDVFFSLPILSALHHSLHED